MELAVELVVEDLVRCLTSFRWVSTHVVDVEIRCTYRNQGIVASFRFSNCFD